MLFLSLSFSSSVLKRKEKKKYLLCSYGPVAYFYFVSCISAHWSNIIASKEKNVLTRASSRKTFLAYLQHFPLLTQEHPFAGLMALNTSTHSIPGLPTGSCCSWFMLLQKITALLFYLYTSGPHFLQYKHHCYCQGFTLTKLKSTNYHSTSNPYLFM